MQKIVIEMVIFETKEGVLEERVLQLFNTLNDVLIVDVEGFIKRSLTKDSMQGKWVEMIWWESMKAAQDALKKVPKLEEFHTYCSILKEQEMIMFHLEEKA